MWLGPRMTGPTFNNFHQDWPFVWVKDVGTSTELLISLYSAKFVPSKFVGCLPLPAPPLANILSFIHVRTLVPSSKTTSFEFANPSDSTNIPSSLRQIQTASTSTANSQSISYENMSNEWNVNNSLMDARNLKKIRFFSKLCQLFVTMLLVWERDHNHCSILHQPMILRCCFRPEVFCSLVGR